MSDKCNWGIHLDLMAECAGKAEYYTRGLDQDSFVAYGQEQVQDAVLYNLALIGEAAGKIPDEIRKAHPEILWQKMTNLRNIICHEYSVIDFDMIWDNLQKDIPKLISSLTILYFKYIAPSLED